MERQHQLHAIFSFLKEDYKDVRTLVVSSWENEELKYITLGTVTHTS